MSEQEQSKVIKLSDRLVDLEKATIDELHQLEREIKSRKSLQIRQSAHRLLVAELGAEYDEFIKSGQVSIAGNNGKKYVIHKDGSLEVFNGDEREHTGQLYRSGYPAEDAVVTFIKYAKLNADALDRLWGCGNIKLTGGEITSD